MDWSEFFIIAVVIVVVVVGCCGSVTCRAQFCFVSSHTNTHSFYFVLVHGLYNLLLLLYFVLCFNFIVHTIALFANHSIFQFCPFSPPIIVIIIIFGSFCARSVHNVRLIPWNGIGTINTKMFASKVLGNFSVLVQRIRFSFSFGLFPFFRSPLKIFICPWINECARAFVVVAFPHFSVDAH